MNPTGKNDTGWKNEATRQLAAMLFNDRGCYESLCRMDRPITRDALREKFRDDWDARRQGKSYGAAPDWVEVAEHCEGILATVVSL